MESNFINYGVHLRRVYADLDFIVVDELHSFLSDVRGIHLRSLVARLSAATGRKFRMIGLSATLGDPQGARSFIAPDAPHTVEIISGTGQQAIKLGIKAHLCSINKVLPLEPSWPSSDASSLFASVAQEELGMPKATTDALDDMAADIIESCADGTNLVFGNAKYRLEILADKLHSQVKLLGLSHDPFHVHHGSLSNDIREETEAILKSGKPATVICSGTLEMGIDIGSIRRVAQLAAPHSVASLRQRLGRSGRRAGEAAVMRVYTIDEAPHEASSVTDLLFLELLRAIALLQLMLAKWLEPHDTDCLNLSTLVHQILSCLRETGGKQAEGVYEVLVKNGAFRNVSKNLFRKVLHALGGKQLIEQLPTGELILAPAGEHITADRNFYAAFAANDEFVIRHDGQEIGKLERTRIPQVGEFLIFNGRRWLVLEIINVTKTVHITPSKGGIAPRFPSSTGEIHTRIFEEMASLLLGFHEPPYLDTSAKTLLKAARKIAVHTKVVTIGYIVRRNSLQWFPWIGTRGMITLMLHARCAGFKITLDPYPLPYSISIIYENITLADWIEHLKSIVKGDRTALDLAMRIDRKAFDKFDDMLPEELLDEANARDRLDLPMAKLRAEQAISALEKSPSP